MKVPERAVTRPVRMCISDLYKGQGSNMCVGGKLDTGYVQNGDRLLLLPPGEVVTVKGNYSPICKIQNSSSSVVKYFQQFSSVLKK